MASAPPAYGSAVTTTMPAVGNGERRGDGGGGVASDVIGASGVTGGRVAGGMRVGTGETRTTWRVAVAGGMGKVGASDLGVAVAGASALNGVAVG